jgi:hypothetical protein
LLKNVKVNDYDGKSISSSIESSIDFNLDKYDLDLLKAYGNLNNWFKKNKNMDFYDFNNLSNSDNL